MKCSHGVISVDVEGTQTNIVLVTTKKANLSSTAFISRLDSVFWKKSIVKIIKIRFGVKVKAKMTKSDPITVSSKILCLVYIIIRKVFQVTFSCDFLIL